MGRYGVSRTTKQLYFFKTIAQLQNRHFQAALFNNTSSTNYFCPVAGENVRIGFLFFFSFFLWLRLYKKKKKNSTGTCCFKLPSVISFFFLIRCGISRLAKKYQAKILITRIHSTNPHGLKWKVFLVCLFFHFVCQKN